MPELRSSFRVLAETELHRGPIVSVGRRDVATPDGTVVERQVVHHPGAVAVVPVLPDGEAVLVRQYRAPVDEEVLEIPAGKRDVEGEAPELTARRELREEVGYEAGELIQLAAWYQSPGFCDEHLTLFLAQDLHQVPAAAQGAEEEHLTVERVPLDEVFALVASGGLVDAKSIVGLLLAREHLASRPAEHR